ncbi:unnamed protein product [Sphagnum balticum]
MIKRPAIQVVDATSLLNVTTPTHPPQGMNSFGRFPSGTVAALDTALHAMTRRAATTAAASDSLQVGKSFRIMMQDHQRDLHNISIAAEISTFALES